LLRFGTVTLIIARLAALIEKELKKIVALSTLRQLGFIIFSIARSVKFITLFHVITHALAKARLFIVVGKVLLENCSEQDSRKTAPARMTLLTKLCGFVRIFSLGGILFFSGFYRKEQFFFGCYYNNNSLLFPRFF